jgi:hypothetical protein
VQHIPLDATGAYTSLRIPAIPAIYSTLPRFDNKAASSSSLQASPNNNNSANNSNSASNNWSEPHAGKILVRSKDYFNPVNKKRSKRKKIAKKLPSLPSLFPILAIDIIRTTDSNSTATTTAPSKHISLSPNSYRNRLHSTHPQVFLLIFNFVLPTANLVIYSALSPQSPNELTNDGNDDPQGPSLLASFINGTDEFRNSRLKMIQNCSDGPWFLKKLVGEAPVLIGRQVPIIYSGNPATDNYLEIAIDINAASPFASSAAAAALAHSPSLTLNLSFVIEASTETELPERLLCSATFHKIDLIQAPTSKQHDERVSNH